jgi:hypothetical protein
MISIKHVSVKAFIVALRWASIKGYPHLLIEWTEEQSQTVQNVALEYDRRHPEHKPLLAEIKAGDKNA